MSLQVLVLGGYGNFGSKIAQRLAPCSDIALTIAGRNAGKARACASALAASAAHPVQSLALDTAAGQFAQQLADSGARLVIHTGGPFQSQDYRVAQACIDNGIHYIDLADGRDFVSGFAPALDAAARRAGVLAVSGASTVPGLSSAVMQDVMGEFSRLDTLVYGISPGNRAERGEATVAAIMGYTGHPFTTRQNGKDTAVYGWQSNHRHRFPAPIGTRWLANCDIPDLSLFPARYPALQTIRFYAGLELSLLHLAMAGMSWLARLGVVANWARHAGPITRLSRWFERFGSDTGGMFMQFAGTGRDGQQKTLAWTLVAEHGDGPLIPTIPAVILAKKLARNALPLTGATACLELFTLDEFFTEVADLSIRQVQENIQ